MKMNGNIVSGQFDYPNNEFVIKQVKHLDTVSSIEKDQIELLYHYLSKNNNGSGQVLSLNDQILLQLNSDEIRALLNDLETILSKLNSSS